MTKLNRKKKNLRGKKGEDLTIAMERWEKGRQDKSDERVNSAYIEGNEKE